MISTLASPSVCVIDDEERDYRPILDALNGLYVSCIHIRGNDLSQLPPSPFGGLRLVFTDLHLNGSGGKGAAAHTANVFLRLVSVQTAPVVVIIWSKYAEDAVGTGDVPKDDQETEATLFKRTLLDLEPAYRERLIFLEMPKPKGDRSADWVSELKVQIAQALEGHNAIQALWSWEAIVRDAGIGTSEELTALAARAAANAGDAKLDPGLQLVMQMLTHAQAEEDLSDVTAPRHLASALCQLLVDRLEHTSMLQTLSLHGPWLAGEPNSAAATGLGPALNGLLFTAAASDGDQAFTPGTVYAGMSDAECKALFGGKIGELVHICFSSRRHDTSIGPEEKKAKDKEDRDFWKGQAQPVLVEISPACDVAQGTRRSAVLIGGVLLPIAAIQNAKAGEAFQALPPFSLRWPSANYAAQDSILVLCCRYKTTLPAATEPAYLKRWFRLRDLPTASLRNWHSGHASRVGYVSVRN